MQQETKTISLRVPVNLLKQLKELAILDGRPLSNKIVMLLRDALIKMDKP
jgi:predicted DNA-binding protein